MFIACVCVCSLLVCVCSPLRQLITSGMIWTLYDWLTNFYTFYVAAVVSIVSKCGLSFDVHDENQPNEN